MANHSAGLELEAVKDFPVGFVSPASYAFVGESLIPDEETKESVRSNDAPACPPTSEEFARLKRCRLGHPKILRQEPLNAASRVSDIHGNLSVLQAVAETLARDRPHLVIPRSDAVKDP